MEEIKIAIAILVAAIVFAALSATLLEHMFITMGAVCMFISGCLLGTLFGYVLALFDGEE